jgi:penicillin-binding protein 1C
MALPLLARVVAMLPAAPRPPEAPLPAERVAALAPPADSLRLLFPPPGAVLSGDGPVTLRAMGGRRPLTFMVDGAPLPGEAARREVNWQPSAPGFFRLAVLDADGQSAHATVRVR